jgi:hypothetical protein
MYGWQWSAIPILLAILLGLAMMKWRPALATLELATVLYLAIHWDQWWVWIAPLFWIALLIAVFGVITGTFKTLTVYAFAIVCAIVLIMLLLVFGDYLNTVGIHMVPDGFVDGPPAATEAP